MVCVELICNFVCVVKIDQTSNMHASYVSHESVIIGNDSSYSLYMPHTDLDSIIF
jgi:hypothetical protein